MTLPNFLQRALSLALVWAVAVACGDGEVSRVGSRRPEVVSFRAAAASVERGDGVLLSWEVLRATSISISANPGGSVLASSADATGQVMSAALEADTTFTLTAANDDGETTTTALVTTEIPRLRVRSFRATPAFVGIGNKATLTYEVRGADSVQILRGGTILHEAPAAQLRSGTVETPALEEGAHTFALVIARGSETITQFALVTALALPAITRFEVTPALFVGPGATATVHWAAENAVGIQLLANGLPVSSFSQGNLRSGQAMVPVSATTELELVVSGVPEDVRARARIVQAVSEVEPNGTPAIASPTGAGVVAGTIAAEDVDVFAVTVPAGGWVFAETSDGQGGCAVDTRLRLLDAAGTELGGSDDLAYDDLCSRVDPRLHVFAANLAAGTYYLQVEAPASGAYVLESRVGSPECGNAVREGSELCDDGNVLAGDGCPATCALDVLGAVTPLQATLPVALGPSAAGFVRVDVQRLGQSISARLTDQAGNCGPRASLTLVNSAFEALDYSESSPAAPATCPEFVLPVRSGRAGFVDLLPGTYYLHVHNQEASATNYQLTAALNEPGCGNGTLETSRGEECDDGNQANGDGCAQNCQVEAEGRMVGPGPERVFSGAINPGNQRDRFVVFLGEPGYIEAQTFTPAPEACSPNDDTVLELYEAGRLIAENDDLAVGTSCSRIAPRGAQDLLPAGVYVVGVRSFADNVINAYAVRIRVTAPGCGNLRLEPGESCDDGNTRGGDGCAATCVREGGGFLEHEPNDRPDLTADDSGATRGATLLVAGTFQSPSDLDTFALDVSAPSRRIIARTHSVAGSDAACAGLDTALDLLDATGKFVARDDDGGPELCSALDSSVTVAAGLTAGRYYLRVRNAGGLIPLPVYFLTVRVE